MRSVEDVLIHEAGVSADILEKAKERLKDECELGALDAGQWAQTLASYYGLPYRETLDPLSPSGEQSDLIARIPLPFAKRYQLFPLGPDGDAITVATAAPEALAALDDLRVLFDKPIRPVVVPKPALTEALNRAYDQTSQATEEVLETIDEKNFDLDAAEWQEPQDLLEADDDAPIIRLVNSLF